MPLSAAEAACVSPVSGKRKEVVSISSVALYLLSVDSIAYNRLTSLASTEKAGRMMFADIIRDSWRAVLLLSPTLALQNLFVCYRCRVDSPYSVSAYLSEIVSRI